MPRVDPGAGREWVVGMDRADLMHSQQLCRYGCENAGSCDTEGSPSDAVRPIVSYNSNLRIGGSAYGEACETRLIVFCPDVLTAIRLPGWRPTTRSPSSMSQKSSGRAGGISAPLTTSPSRSPMAS